MPRGILRTECRICERHVAEVGKLSARGKCAGCGNGRMLENNAAMRLHSGPFYVHWRARMLAAFGIAEQPRTRSLDGDREQA